MPQGAGWLSAWWRCVRTLARRVLIAGAVACAAWIALALAMSWIAAPGETTVAVDESGGTRLVVVVHGLSSRAGIAPTVALVRETFPQADLLTIEYDARPLSNADVYDVANRLETRIHDAHDRNRYESIVMVGHSMGAMLVRKALLWGSGIEEDRVAAKGRRDWTRKVDRVVSLAGINRGWSVDPKPANMPWWRYALFRFGETVARLTGSGGMILSIQRGAPFIADSRVQWIRYARRAADGGGRGLPQVIHLLGDRDDIVSRADAQDLSVDRSTIFVTLPGTDHGNIAAALSGGGDDEAEFRRTAIRNALAGRLDRLSPDRAQELEANPAVRRVIYVMHGIRDHGGWTDAVRAAVEKQVADDPAVAVINKKYGYFPMLRFLLYWDRHKNVRRLMDEYTENLARYPNVERFDFAGHSNGTYLLASALQHYRTIRVGRVFFAGSVVPKHYPWRPLIDTGRVGQVVNVVADGDWVVAIFPKLFEQFADWLSVQPAKGVLDLGSAGFRGFQAAADPSGRVRDLKFVRGGHGAGVDAADPDKLAAIVDYLVAGRLAGADVFVEAATPAGWLDIASNVSWLVWIFIAALLLALVALAFLLHRLAGVASVVFVVALLMSV